MHLQTSWGLSKCIWTQDNMIDKMAHRCSSIPSFNVLSDLLIDLVGSFYNHFLKFSAIDSFLGWLCAGTGDVVNALIQQTANTLPPFRQPQGTSPARTSQRRALATLQYPYPDCFKCLTHRETFNIICEWAVRVSRRHQPAVNKATCRINDDTYRMGRVP